MANLSTDALILRSLLFNKLNCLLGDLIVAELCARWLRRVAWLKLNNLLGDLI